MDLKLKQVRESTGKTQEQVAQELGIPLGTYRNWEQTARGLNTKKLIMLADYYGVSTDTILGTRFAQSIDDQVQRSNRTKIETLLINASRNLNDEGNDRLLEYADDLIRSGKYQKIRVPDSAIPGTISA